MCASPDYLQRFGEPKEPKEPKDLQNHQGLFYQLQGILNDTWKLSDENQIYKVTPKAYCAANDGDLVRRWCVAGKGIAIKSVLDLAEDILAGRVIPLLTEYKIEQGELWLVCPSRQSITPTVLLLRDVFREKTKALLVALIEKGIL